MGNVCENTVMPKQCAQGGLYTDIDYECVLSLASICTTCGYILKTVTHHFAFLKILFYTVGSGSSLYLFQETEDGLFICMNTFLGLGRRHVEMYFRKTSHAVFLRIKRIRHEVRSEMLILMDLCFYFENSNICGFNEIEACNLNYFILYTYEVLRFVQVNPINTGCQG